MPRPFIPSARNDSIGEQYVSSQVGPLGGSNKLYGTTPLTSAGVTNIPMPASAAVQSIKDLCVTLAGTVPAGTGTLTVRLRKRQADGTYVNLTNTISLFGKAQYDVLTAGLAANTTAIERQVRISAADVVMLTFDNTGGTITTQPTDLFAVGRFCVES